jgi:hypothetical protein
LDEGKITDVLSEQIGTEGFCEVAPVIPDVSGRK